MTFYHLQTLMGLLCFFAPQYAEQIQEKMAEKERFPRSEYDEQHLEMWESLLKRSMLEGLEVEVNYLSNEGFALISGIVTEVNLLKKTVCIKTGGTSKTVFFKNILGVEEA